MRKMLQAALESEVEVFLAQHAARVDDQGHRQMVRNGHLLAEPPGRVADIPVCFTSNLPCNGSLNPSGEEAGTVPSNACETPLGRPVVNLTTPDL